METVDLTFKQFVDFEAGLAPGVVVCAAWSSCYRRFEALARVVRVNAKSVRVALDEAVGEGRFSYPKGWEMTIPRFTANFSLTNTVTPRETRGKAVRYAAHEGLR